MGAPTIEAEGLFSVSYTSTKLGNLATGFSMTMSGPPGSLTGKKTVKVSNGESTGKWGSESGVVLSEGRRVSRLYEGDSVVVVDPMYELFQKLVYFHTGSTMSFAEAVSGAGSFVSLSPIETVEAIYNKLATGKIQAFLEQVIEPDGLITDYSKVMDSPIVSALSGTTGYGEIKGNTINVAEKILAAGEIMSVGDIFSKFISPLGLELYWDGQDGYSLEPPRLSAHDTTPVDTITKKEIIELRMNIDPYNVPDVVIPSIAFRETLGAGNFGLFTQKSLSAGILKNLGSKNLKVSTFEMPDFLINPIKAAVRGAASISYDSYESGMPNLGGTQETADDIARFFGSHARKSALYAQKTGECIMMLNPKMTKAYSWYTIDGMKCFVSDIRHEVNRSSAMTILTIAGVEDPTILTDGGGGGGNSSTPGKEAGFISGLSSEFSSETTEILTKAKKGQEVTKNNKGKTTEEDMSKVFSDSEADEETIQGTPVSEIASMKSNGGQSW